MFATAQASVEDSPAVIVGGFAVKLDTTGEGPVGTLSGVYTGPIKTTSKSEAVSVLS